VSVVRHQKASLSKWKQLFDSDNNARTALNQTSSAMQVRTNPLICLPKRLLHACTNNKTYVHAINRGARMLIKGIVRRLRGDE